MKYIIAAIALITLAFSVKAQGVLSGSLESNNIRYLNDDKTGATTPDDLIGSNNYLKVNYSQGSVSLGLQYEGYFPSLVGFSGQLNGAKLTNRYIRYHSDLISTTVGHFYEQFGSGLIFRTYEERSLGINNALDGVNVEVKPVSYISIKGVWGKQRKYMQSGEGIVRGVDANFSIGELLKNEALLFDIGGSYVSRFEDYTGPEEDFPETVDAYAFRGQFDVGGMSVYSEYVLKGEDPSPATSYRRVKGNAFLLNSAYSSRGFGVNVSVRRLENMDFRSERDAMGEASMINYLPALTRQHGYSLALLHPYSTMVNGEIGGQIDLFYNIKKGSAIGGRYGTKLHLNFAQYHSLNPDQWLAIGDQVLYSDLSFDITRKWNRKLKTIISLVNQNYNDSKTGASEFVKSYIAIGDVQYKFSSRFSLRGEVQHLWSKQDEQNWVMGLLECSYAPSLTIFASDMYNYGRTEVHYYNIGGGYSAGSTKFTLGYARNREGLQCVGGVCRYVPAFSGLSLSITSQF